jgi:transposase-like protein
LEGDDFVALLLDFGKTFGTDEMVIGLGVTMEGRKIPLGFVQTGTENERVGREMLEGLLERGLKITDGLLCVIDGSKGLSLSPFLPENILPNCKLSAYLLPYTQ